MVEEASCKAETNVKDLQQGKESICFFGSNNNNNDSDTTAVKLVVVGKSHHPHTHTIMYVRMLQPG